MMTCLAARSAGWGPGSFLALAGIFLFVVPVLAAVGVPLASGTPSGTTVRGRSAGSSATSARPGRSDPCPIP